MHEYALISVNMPENGWVSLNMAESAWINSSDYTGVLNMLWYSYNNIVIIVTNVIILEFLSAWFVHSGFLSQKIFVQCNILLNTYVT